MPHPPSAFSMTAHWRLAFTALMCMCCAVMPGIARADDIADVRALIARGDLPAALARVEQAVATRPRDVQLRFLQAVVLMESRRDDAALALFMQLSQEFPELPDPHNNIALLHARGGRLEAALAEIQEALRTEPGHRTARANLGQLYLLLAVKAWEDLALSGPIEPALKTRLDGARALVASSTIGAR